MEFPKFGNYGGYSVDENGGIWFALVRPWITGVQVGVVKFMGVDEHGIPRYGEKWEDIPIPTESGEPNINGWGNMGKVHYSAKTDTMVIVAPSRHRREGTRDDPHHYMACYPDWSKGNRKARWWFELPTPNESPDFMYEVGRPYGVAFQYMGLDVAGDKIFICDLWGSVHVYDIMTGKRVINLSPGPEVAGSGAWEDAAMGLRAFRRSNGEYLIFTENSGWGAKVNLYRWKP